jgi:hypothetical protein
MATKGDSVTANYRRFLTGARTGEDGLTYKESVHRAGGSSFWASVSGVRTSRCAARWRGLPDERPDGTGAHSLGYLARQAINRNLEHLGLDALLATPWHPLGRYIWDDIRTTYPFPSTTSTSTSTTTSSSSSSSCCCCCD